MNTEWTIDVDNVSKEFIVPVRRDATVLLHLRSLFRKTPVVAPPGAAIAAVRDLSFRVRKGEVLGVIGKNGSGKSTLLRLLAGILTPDAGAVTVNGPVTSLINLSVGLRHRLSVHDNIFLCCALFGMSRKETLARFDDIVQFAELDDALDLTPAQLSNGMNQRLAFSIAVHADPEVLLLDEVFSAGDIGFVAKSEKRMTDLIRGRATVVMVSHSPGQMRKLCDRVLWMDKGKACMIGDPATVVDAYIKYAMAEAAPVPVSPPVPVAVPKAVAV